MILRRCLLHLQSAHRAFKRTHLYTGTKKCLKKRQILSLVLLIISIQHLRSLKGNEAVAKEQSEKLDRIEADIAGNEKKKRELEREKEIMDERIDILEALNDRPGATIEDKINGEHKDAFLGWMRTGGRDQTADQRLRDVIKKSREYKNITTTSPSTGGYAVPEEIASEVDRLLLKQSDILNEVKVVQVGTSDYKELITIQGGNSGWVGEDGSRTATGTPTLREVVPTWGELYAYPQITEWSAQDMFFNVQDWLVNDIVDGMGKNLDSAIWTGDGSNKPTGLEQNAPTSTADGSPQRTASVLQYIPTDAASPLTTVGADDVIDLVYALNRSYRGNAKFGANSVTQGALRKLKSSNGDYYWQPSLQEGQPANLLGYSVFTFEDMDDFDQGDGLYLGFGDWRRAYTLCHRAELNITANDLTNPGYIKFYVRRRYAGIVTNNDALKLLKYAGT